MTNNKQQTTVDWIEQEMLKGNLSLKEILEQAKEMEKERLVKAWMDGVTGDSGHSTAIGYYNETYGGNK
jgi:hypothetical protein